MMRSALKRTAVLGAAGVAFLLAGHDARAAGTARLDVFPERPRTGAAATIQLRTYWTYPDRTPPAVFPANYPMIVAASGPQGRRVETRLVRDGRDPHLWRGLFRFPLSGRWVVCGANFQPGLHLRCPSANPARKVVRVAARTAVLDVWQRLQRPLAVASLKDDASCPTAAAEGDLHSRGWDGPAWGPGPAYPVGLADGPALHYLDPIPRSSEFFGSAWFGNKVLWFIDRRAYRGPVLIRGRQLDGPNLLRFERGRVPPRELRISAATGETPSYTRVSAAGCYAYQVDGLEFSYTIVFHAQPS